MEEVWKPLPDWEDLYEVSDKGRVRSITHVVVRTNERNYTAKGRILKPASDKSGYKYVALCNNGNIFFKKVHRLVALTFLPNPLNYPMVNHKNEIKSDNRANNLEWCTAKYNCNYGTGIKRGVESRKGKMKNNPLLSKAVLMVSKDGTVLKEFPSLSEAQRQTGIANQNISDCIYGKRNHRTAGGYVWRFKCENI